MKHVKRPLLRSVGHATLAWSSTKHHFHDTSLFKGGDIFMPPFSCDPQPCSGTTGKDVDVKSYVQGEGIQGLSTDFQIIKADRS